METVVQKNTWREWVKKNAWIFYLLCLSAFISLFAFQTSPFYPINTWEDPNCFLTVGRAILDGKVMYRDIYEQKGPYVYFVHAFATLISDTSFFGVWLMEIVVWFFSMFLIVKIVGEYGYKRSIGVVIATLVGLSACFSYAMSTGDSVEEFVAPLYLWLLYITVKNIKREQEYTSLQYLFIGVTAGLVFWSKFTLVGIYVGWFAYFVWKNIRKKQYKEIAKSLLYVVLGIAVATLPCLLYFVYHNAIGDWLTSYLYNNLFLYSEGEGIFAKIFAMLKAVALTLVFNAQYNLFALFGAIYFIWKKRGEERWFLTWILSITTVVLYIGGRGYRYYGLPLYVFAVFGYISLVDLIIEKGAKFLKPLGAVCGVLMIFSSVGFFFVNGNQHCIFKQKDEMAQYQVANYIREYGDEDATLLTWGMLDSGFYLALEQVPQFKHFNRLNIPLQEQYDEVQRYMDEGLADFIIFRAYDDVTEIEHERYVRVDQEFVGWLHNMKITYILYQLKA